MDLYKDPFYNSLTNFEGKPLSSPSSMSIRRVDYEEKLEVDLQVGALDKNYDGYQWGLNSFFRVIPRKICAHYHDHNQSWLKPFLDRLREEVLEPTLNTLHPRMQPRIFDTLPLWEDTSRYEPEDGELYRLTVWRLNDQTALLLAARSLALLRACMPDPEYCVGRPIRIPRQAPTPCPRQQKPIPSIEI